MTVAPVEHVRVARWVRLRLVRHPPWVVLAAAVGAALLVVIAASRWTEPHDQAAYWRAGIRLAHGEPLYAPGSPADTPYAYWYPPPLAQVLAPFTRIVPEAAFVVGWAVLQLACVLFLADGDVLAALALIAFPPVATELFEGNVHLQLAALAVLALRRSPAFWIAGTALKLSPVLGIPYLFVAGRPRTAVVVTAAGVVIVGISVFISPGAWLDFAHVVTSRAIDAGGSLIPVPYAVRLAVGVGLAVLAGRLGGLRGQVVLVVAITLASPTLWFHTLSILAAIVPLVRGRRSAPVPVHPARPAAT